MGKNHAVYYLFLHNTLCFKFLNSSERFPINFVIHHFAPHTWPLNTRVYMNIVAVPFKRYRKILLVEWF